MSTAPGWVNAREKLLNMYPGQPSSVKTLRPTRLLDLPNDILSRILDFLIPPVTIFPTTPPQSQLESSIGLTCHRLFNLVKPRFQVLDFVSPKSLTELSECPKKVFENMLRFAMLSSPFAEVVRFPTDVPVGEDVLPVRWCPNLREICLTFSDENDPRDVRQFFHTHNNLQVLTLHIPSRETLLGLASAPFKLRMLNLITLQSSERTLAALDALLATMSGLQSLTISFHPNYRTSCASPLLHDLFSTDRSDKSCSPSRFMIQLSTILRKNHQSLSALRQLAVWAGPRERIRGAQNFLQNFDLARQVTHIGQFVDLARELAFDDPPDLKIIQLRLRTHNQGEMALEEFMRHLVDTSTEVVVKFYHMTVCYPVVIDKCDRPKPIITELYIDYDSLSSSDEGASSENASDEDENYEDSGLTPFENEYYTLRQSVEFRLESLTIDRKNSATLLTMERHHKVLADFLRGNNLKFLWFHYHIGSVEDVETTLKALHLVSDFAPTISEISLNYRIVFYSQHIVTDEMKKIKCLENVRVLRLYDRADPRLAFGNAFFPIQLFEEFQHSVFVHRLPKFLEEIRQAFPSLTHLYMEQLRGIGTMDQLTFHRAEEIIKRYEHQTGVDASSLRMVLETRICP